MKNRDGIVFGSFDSLEEEMLLTYRESPPPDEKEIKESLAFVQGDYDFSRILGEAIRENREVKYEFFIKENDVSRRKTLEIKYENMLLNQGLGKIYDTLKPGHYYYGKCINAEVDLDTTWQQLKLIVTFDCYPYMISELPEGHDIWDEFNFELDVAQKTKFEAESDWSTFKELQIGDQATYGAWATRYMHPENETGVGNRIEPDFLGRTYRIVNKRSVNQSSSKIAYKLAEVDEWLLEQDVLQAQTKKTEGILYNTGATSVVPTITTTDKITIIKGNTIYNLMAGTYKDELFRVDIGENPIEIYAHKLAEVEFNFHKELI